MPSLESTPAESDRRSEGRWGRAALLVALAVLASLVPVALHLRRQAVRAEAPVDHGPLPEAVRAQVLAILDRHLEEVRLEEVRQGPLREFHVRGRSRAALAQDFHKAFRPAVVNGLMPLLRPYGEIISFDIASLDLPPARLRPLPKD
jgi:hypothetical protein